MGLIMNGNSGKKYIFEGPFEIDPSVDHAPAVFAILKENCKDVKLLDIGGSDILYKNIYQVDKLVKKSDNTSCRIKYAVFYNWNEEPASYEVIAKDIKKYYKI